MQKSLFISVSAICLMSATPAIAENVSGFEATSYTQGFGGQFGNVDAGLYDSINLRGDLTLTDANDDTVRLHAHGLRRSAAEFEGHYGNLDAFWGNLDAFYGNLDAFWGNLDAFYGNLDAFYGNLDAFYGNLDAFWGNLDAFYGNLDAFYGNLDAFWGNLDAFDGDAEAFYGNLDAFYGNLDAFWGNLDAFWGNLDAFWGNLDAFSTNVDGYAQVATDIQSFIDMSAATFGPMVTGFTGQSFDDAFVSGMLEKHGINLDDPASLESLSAADRARFFLDWHDQLMLYSGRDSVDVWMNQINWTPAITQQQGEGADTVIGLLDFSVANDADILDNLFGVDGVSDVAGGHGAGVASLMVGAHDGRGVMGIAPNASVTAYNPFDDTRTAGWSDISLGISHLIANDASIINMSLGVPGYTLHPEWENVFKGGIVPFALNNTVFVKAAGNDGSTQTQNIRWDFGLLEAPALIVVGAIGWDGEIAEWSNRPGTACLTDWLGRCGEGDRLMDNFIVAPGEMILVADDEGGVHRQSGTSFAAPLVSGAIALLHDRWPWLAEHPHETVDIILRSAKDLGAPGTDPIYGRGLLDVEASQSPLDFEQLTYMEVSNKNGKIKEKQVKAKNIRVKLKQWETKNVYFHAFEQVGDTFRDFAIPMSSNLVGQTVDVKGGQEYLQAFIYDRFVDWMNGNKPGSSHLNAFSDATTINAPLNRGSDWTVSFNVSNQAPDHLVRDGELPFQTEMSLQSRETGTTYRFGNGQGAMALASSEGFGLFSDYDPETGGANPFLGLASGGVYAAASVPILENATLSFGMTENRQSEEYVDPITGEYLDIVEGLVDYEASAVHMDVAFEINPALTATVGYTQLQEDTGLLGVRGLEPISLEGGAVTDATTFGASVELGRGVSLHSSATVGRTRSDTFGDGQLELSDKGAVSTAWQVMMAKSGIFSDRDAARISFAQPMHIETGELSFESQAVVDRSTGEIGTIVQTFDINTGERPFVAEGIYAMPIVKNTGELSAFARAEYQTSHVALTDKDSAYLAGARVAFKF